MTRQPPALVLNGATSQYDRWLRALDAGYAPVDGRSLAELLAFAPRFGGLIYFYNLQDEPEGDWTPFFLTDSTMVLASIEALDLTAVETEYRRAERRAGSTREPEDLQEGLREVFQILHGLGRRVDLWLKGLVGGQGTRARQGGRGGRGSRAVERVRREIAAEVESRLGGAMRRLEAYDRGAGAAEALGTPIGLDYQRFGALWKLGQAVPDDSPYRRGSTGEPSGGDSGDGSPTSGSRGLGRTLPSLRELFTTVTASLSALQSVTEEQLEESLETGDQAPQVALYAAFAQLFGTAQDTVNTMSTRYQRFYYRDVLREGRRGPVPDRVFLTFTLAAAEDVLSTTVPRGTLFPAGEDEDGREILFALERAVAVSAAALAEIRTLRRLDGALYQPLEMITTGATDGTPDETPDQTPNEVPDQAPVRVLSTVVVPEPETEDGWATFGVSEVGRTVSETTEPASLGFALATPYLLLTGGTRSITLTVEYPESFESEVLKPRLDALAEATGLDPAVIWSTVLESAFQLYFSTASGWFLFEGTYGTITPGFGGFQTRAVEAGDFTWVPWFALALELSDTSPAVEGYDPEADEAADEEETETPAAPVTEDPEVVATNPAPGTPTLKLYLRQEAVTLSGERGTVEVYPLSLLAGLEAVGLQLAVGVDGLPVETLANTDGEIDPESPFPVFGGVPTQGSYLQISHSEIFSKVPRSLDVGIQWFNLPPNSNGFKGWYRDYVLNLDGEPQADLFDNAKFHGDFRLRNPGSWCLQLVNDQGEETCPAEVPVYLFRTDNDCNAEKPTQDGKLCPASGFALETCTNPQGVPSYYDPSQSALRLVLTEPDYAFGNDLYTQNVLKAVLDVLPEPEACQDRCEGECGPLMQAAELLGQCLTQCAETPEDPAETPEGQYAACIEPCVKRCQGVLLAGAVLCILRCLEEILRCLEESKDAEQADRFSRLEARVHRSRELPPRERARILQQALEDLREWGESQGQDSGLCETKCRRFLDGYYCLADCLANCCEPDPGGTLICDKDALVECLTFCQVGLEEAYGECLQECVEGCSQEATEDLKYPNEPYLPQAQSVFLGYQAETSLSGFYQLLPFGGYQATEIGTDSDGNSGTDPDTDPPLLLELPASGNLYLGFSELIPPQVLTLLVQMTTADDPVAGADLPEIAWQALAGNTWQTLDPAEILVDTTYGLENTGLLELDLPRYDADDHTVAPPAYQWLRATVDTDPWKFPRTRAVTPHAGLAVWTPDDGNEEGEGDEGGEATETSQTGDHLAEPIPAGTITSSVEDLADVESIEQPLASFGGRPPEDRRAYEIRLGERLRHKDRAILDWDYERLVLERFPSIWKVQALPARTAESGDAPGCALVVVVPGPDQGEAMDPTVPRAPGEVLRQIQSYLEARTSPFVELQVTNPLYVRITVFAEVEFRDDGEGGGSIGRLNDDLVDYLSPWFYDQARASKGGRYASESDIAEFVRTRPYVQRLVAIDFLYSLPREELEWYFLTSARSHNITEVVASNGGSNPPCNPST